MNRTRDIIQEIAEVRRRRRFSFAMAELSSRLSALERAFNQHDRTESELVRYFPVAIIACIESYFRMAIGDLIDAGDPYLTNAEKLASSVKLDFSVLRAIHGKAITVGELIGHGVQLSRLEHIEMTLSNLLGTGFLQALRSTTDRWAHEVAGKPPIPMLANPDEVFAYIAKAFEMRHIICHEMASAYEIKSEEVSKCFESCVAFLRVAEEFISETLHPGAPLTQTEMNIAAARDLSEKRKQLEGAVIALKSRLNTAESKSFDESQSKWQIYCDAWANFVAGEQAGAGTIRPLICAKAAEAVVDRRLEEIKKYRRLSDPA